MQSRYQWWSLETPSRAWDSSPDPFLRVSFSKVSVSSRSRRLQVLVTSLLFENFNTATIWHNKISVIQCAFCLLYLQVRNDQSRQEKCQKFEKNSISKWWWHFLENFRKILPQSTNFQVAVSISKRTSRVPDFLMKSRSRRFDQVSDSTFRSRLHHWC